MRTTPSPKDALAKAIDSAGGRAALMRKLNECGHEIKTPSVVGQWAENGTPAKYCPDIEAITGVRCEELAPDVNWSVLREHVHDSDVKPLPAEKAGA